jgi:hypothetical protein
MKHAKNYQIFLLKRPQSLTHTVEEQSNLNLTAVKLNKHVQRTCNSSPTNDVPNQIFANAKFYIKGCP